MVDEMGNLTRLTLVATPTDLPIGNPDLEMLHALTYTTQVGNTYTHIHTQYIHADVQTNKPTVYPHTYNLFNPLNMNIPSRIRPYIHE